MDRRCAFGDVCSLTPVSASPYPIAERLPSALRKHRNEEQASEHASAPLVGSSLVDIVSTSTGGGSDDSTTGVRPLVETHL